MISRRSFVSTVAAISAGLSLPSVAPANIPNVHTKEDSLKVVIKQLRTGELPWHPRWGQSMLLAGHMGECCVISEGEVVLVPTFEITADVKHQRKYIASRVLAHLKINNIGHIRNKFVAHFGNEPSQCIVYVRDYLNGFSKTISPAEWFHMPRTSSPSQKRRAYLNPPVSVFVDADNMVSVANSDHYYKTIGIVMFGGKEPEPSIRPKYAELFDPMIH